MCRMPAEGFDPGGFPAGPVEQLGFLRDQRDGGRFLFGKVPRDAAADLARPADDGAELGVVAHGASCFGPFSSEIPSRRSFRCSEVRSMPTKAAVRVIFPPKRASWEDRYCRSNCSRAAFSG